MVMGAGRVVEKMIWKRGETTLPEQVLLRKTSGELSSEVFKLTIELACDGLDASAFSFERLKRNTHLDQTSTR